MLGISLHISFDKKTYIFYLSRIIIILFDLNIKHVIPLTSYVPFEFSSYSIIHISLYNLNDDGAIAHYCIH